MNDGSGHTAAGLGRSSLSGELYRALFEESTDPMFIADRNGFVVAVNQRGAELTGHSPERMIGMRLSDLISREGSVAKRKDGGLVPVEFGGRALSEGYLLEVVRDISGRKQLEALRASEETYRSLVEAAEDPMFMTDAVTRRYIYVNPVAAAVLGKIPEEVVGKAPEDLFPPEVAEKYNAGVRHVVETGETLTAHDLSEVHGKKVWFSSVVQPVRNRQGQITAVQAIVRDITSLKLAEEALRENEERLRQAIRVSNIGIFDHDHVTGTLYYSPKQREICGLSPDEPILFANTPGDSNQGTWDLAHPDDREQAAAAVRRAHDPKSDGVFDLEHRIIRRDGSVRWLSTRSQTFFEGEGDARRPVRTVGGVVDVTERKRAEAERQLLQGQLLQAQKMESVGRLAGGVAHDFNNMLNVICGYAELAVEQLEPTEPLFGPIDEIRKAGRRSAELTGQLLTFARRQPVAPKVLNLNERIERSLNMLRRLIGENIRPIWMPGRDLWSVRVDPTQIDQILVNLSVNARDAISTIGQLKILTTNVVLDAENCRQHPGSVPGEYVMLEVTDDGVGMDAETRSHIFEPFFTTKGESQNTGLGLATVYGIVKQNEGFISVSSEIGSGTTVQVLLPRSAGETDRIAEARTAIKPKKGTETVLLVEDEPMVLGLGKHLLETLGYTVLPAGTPYEALRLAEEHGDKIQLLLTDVVMPEMNGPDLAKRLTAAYPHLKCMFVSGYFSGSSPMRVVLDEGAHFLHKPFKVADLAARVREALEAS